MTNENLSVDVVQHGWLGRPRSLAVLAILVGLSGVLLILAVALVLGRSTALSFVLSGLGVLKSWPRVAAASVITAFGAALIVTSFGVWFGKRWAFTVGLILSLIQIFVSVLGHDPTSFLLIRGVGVIIVMLALRHHFYFCNNH